MLRDGTLPGYPRAIAQTTDGYLWLATEFGLLRFDGVRFTAWQPRTGPPLPSNRVMTLLAGRDGALWVGTTDGLARLERDTLTAYPGLAGQFIAALAETRDGTVWVGTNGGRGNARLCAIRVSAVSCVDEDGSVGRFVLSLHQDDAGGLWVGASNGLWRWSPGTPTAIQTPAAQEIHGFAKGDNGSLLVAVNRDILALVGQTLVPYPVSGYRDLKPTVLLRDRDDSLWIGTQDRGLLHVSQGRVRAFGRADGLSGDFIVSLFEDREGNVWVGTLNGLDQFRDVAAARLSVKQGLTNDTVMAVHASGTGGVWLSTVGGLDEWHDGQTRRRVIAGGAGDADVGSLFEDSRGWLWIATVRGLFSLAPSSARAEPARGIPTRYVHAMAEDAAHTLWISDLHGGLFRRRGDGAIDRLPWSQFAGKDARALAPSAAGGMWLGFSQSGVAHVKDGAPTRTIDVSEGLAEGRVNHLHVDRNGALWVATQGGLSRVTDDRVVTMRHADGLPCDSVQWVIEDDARALWIYTACGLARVTRDALDRWLRDPSSAVQRVVYDTADNILRYADLGGYGPKVTKARDGRLWFATYDGVGIVNPAKLPSNSVSPPVHIELVTADRETYDGSGYRRLPARLHDLRLDYTALSLVAPDKIRFRYKLEGRDHDWVDAADRRQAYYTDLPPGDYRFRVVAANNRGIWNEEGAAWDFSIAPTFYQTRMFLLAAALTIVAAAYALYHLRVRRLAAQMNARFEERLGERTRIAQELHDTLLQGFISASMQLHVLDKQIADERARPELTRILSRISEVIAEGRQAVQGLRAPKPEPLERVLPRHGESFRGTQPIDIHVGVRGEPQLLRPAAYDAAYQVGREALANAMRHAEGRRVEIDVEYAADGFNLRVRDDGRGIDPHIVTSGRDGHWGLANMRARAEQIGATLRLWSRLDAGTEVELKIPRRIAFEAAAARGWRRWLRGGTSPNVLR